MNESYEVRRGRPVTKYGENGLRRVEVMVSTEDWNRIAAMAGVTGTISAVTRYLIHLGLEARDSAKG